MRRAVSCIFKPGEKVIVKDLKKKAEIVGIDKKGYIVQFENGKKGLQPAWNLRGDR